MADESVLIKVKVGKTATLIATLEHHSKRVRFELHSGELGDRVSLTDAQAQTLALMCNGPIAP